MVKVSKKFKKVWKFYTDNMDNKKFQFCGENIHINEDSSGLTALECMFLLESTGKYPTCREPEILKKAIIFKKSINLHIKMWAEGYCDMLMGVNEYLQEFKSPPPWIEKAFRKQILASYKENQ